MPELPTSAMAAWYRVDDWKMETACQWCGQPLVVGDKALEAFGEIFCSLACAKTSHRRLLGEV